MASIRGPEMGAKEPLGRIKHGERGPSSSAGTQMHSAHA